MPCQLPVDCLNEIFELLEDKATLHSCLLVNRLWCEVSVRILWRNIWYFNTNACVYPQILNTLVACLPDESKGHLFMTPTSKPPLFNYASFCKVLLIGEICTMIKIYFKKRDKHQILSNSKYLVMQAMQEMLKMFMNQVSLKKLIYYTDHEIPNFTHFPGARDCLKDLSELTCSSDVGSEFFYQLSQICHNIRSLNIQFGNTISNGLNDLISSQNSLKSLSAYGSRGWTNIIPSLAKHSKTLIKLNIEGKGPLSFIAKFTNLQVLILSRFDYYNTFKDLQYATFPQLQILKFQYGSPDIEKLINFLEINGENLKEFYVHNSDDSLNLAIAKFCPNLKSLCTLFINDGIETLKVIFDSCQQLESFGTHLKEKELLEIIAKHSPDSFHELKIYNHRTSQLLPIDLESFFISWKNRRPQKSLSFIIPNGRLSLVKNKENKKIIKKYQKSGVIKRFEALYVVN